MPRLLPVFLLSFALFGLTGCPTPPKVAPRVTHIPDVGATPVQPPAEVAPPVPDASAVAVTPPGLTPATKPTPAPSNPTPAAAPVAPVPTAPTIGTPPATPLVLDASLPVLRPLRYPTDRWIPWRSWSEALGFGVPQRLKGLPVIAFEQRLTNTVVVLTAGSRQAQWNGIQVGLGFEPRNVGGELMVHGLDVAKNLETLLSPNHHEWTNRVVVIDPGHGGENLGTKSFTTGQLEKDLTLDWGLRLRPLLEARGWHVVMTRTNDITINWAERVAVADRAQAALFISLHFNSVEAREAARLEAGGVETYCLTPTGMPSSLIREFEDDPRKVYPNNAFDAENLRIATRTHRFILANTRQNDRGVRRARFMTVLQEQRRPAILIEGGYLTVPSEARQLAQASFRQRLAEGVAQALE